MTAKITIAALAAALLGLAGCATRSALPGDGARYPEYERWWAT